MDTQSLFLQTTYPFECVGGPLDGQVRHVAPPHRIYIVQLYDDLIANPRMVECREPPSEYGKWNLVGHYAVVRDRIRWRLWWTFAPFQDGEDGG